MAKHIIDLEELLRTPLVDWDYGFDLSPEGARLAFSWNLSGRWEIYLADLQEAAPPRRVTAGEGAKFAPRWSPDGKRLAYTLDVDGGELNDIYLLDLATGEHTNLTPDTPEAIQPEVSWSPDGRFIAFAADRRGKFEAYVIPSAGGEPRLLCELPYPVWKVAWSPDGAWLAATTIARGQDTYIYLIPPNGGEPRLLSEGGEALCAKDAAWSPDGQRLAFSGVYGGEHQIGVLTLEEAGPRWLTHGAGAKEYPAWSPDGRRLCYVTSHGGTSALHLLDLESGALSSFQVAPGQHYRPLLSADGGQVVFVFDNPCQPGDLWAWSLGKDAARQLTHSLPASLSSAQFHLPREVTYPSLDGRPVPALLYAPTAVDSSKPAIISIHGGPNWHAQVTWDPLVQHMVSRGWTVLAPNYRGSTGYGREHQLANRFDLGGGDTLDVVAGADFLVENEFADPKCIAVTGRSYGGYLTMTSLTRFPQRWVGGSAVVPFLNWFTGHANSRPDLQHWDLENFGDPERDYQRYYERSPFFFLNRIQAPVQLICGAHDPRCPASESLQARDALLSLGKSCDLALYEDEGHVFLKVENVIEAKVRQANFLARVLEGT
ncbi:MAG: S9 family peptidase [Anaerolineales bacterium]|nr:S9 family peptidase [Anaerolineales bacterium]